MAEIYIHTFENNEVLSAENLNTLGAAITLLNNQKVEIDGGKGLSSYDYTYDDKIKVQNLPSDTTYELNKKYEKPIAGIPDSDLQQNLRNIIGQSQSTAYRITSESNDGNGWSVEPLDTNYPSEKLVKESLDGKLNNDIQIKKGSGSNSIILNDLENSTVTGSYSVSEGQNTKVTASYAHAEGQNTSAEGNYSHAEGNNTKAIGANAHVEGEYFDSEWYLTFNDTQYKGAYGEASHAEGYNTESEGNYSHAEGKSTKSIGQSSHSEGYLTKAYGEASHAEGYNTETNNIGEHASGKFNKSNIGGLSTTLFSVGNGSDENNRKNAFEITNNLNDESKIYIQGLGGYNGKNLNANTKDLKTLIEEIESGGVSDVELTINKVSEWSEETSNTNYPSEKLVKDSLDEKVVRINMDDYYSDPIPGINEYIFNENGGIINAITTYINNGSEVILYSDIIENFEGLEFKYFGNDNNIYKFISFSSANNNNIMYWLKFQSVRLEIGGVEGDCDVLRYNIIDLDTKKTFDITKLPTSNDGTHVYYVNDADTDIKFHIVSSIAGCLDKTDDNELKVKCHFNEPAGEGYTKKVKIKLNIEPNIQNDDSIEVKNRKIKKACSTKILGLNISFKHSDNQWIKIYPLGDMETVSYLLTGPADPHPEEIKDLYIVPYTDMYFAQPAGVHDKSGYFTKFIIYYQ